MGANLEVKTKYGRRWDNGSRNKKTKSKEGHKTTNRPPFCPTNHARTIVHVTSIFPNGVEIHLPCFGQTLDTSPNQMKLVPAPSTTA